MDIRQINYFLQLADNEHMSATADFLNISQPSLSKAIQHLEKELGIKLFDRVGNRIRLNKNGRQFAEYARQSMALLEAGRLSAKRMVYETTGNISIGCYTYIGILNDCVHEYLKINPYISFCIQELHHYSDANRIQSLDFILAASNHREQQSQQRKTWVEQTLFQENYVLIYMPDLLGEAAANDPVSIQELQGTYFITMVQNSIFWNDITYTLCAAAGFFPKIRCETDDFTIKVKMVAAGQGVAFIPQCCIADALKIAPQLCQSPIAGTTRRVSLMRQRRGIATEAAMDFWDFVLDYYGQTDLGTD